MAMAAYPALTGPRTTSELGFGGDIKPCEKPVITVFGVEYLVRACEGAPLGAVSDGRPTSASGECHQMQAVRFRGLLGRLLLSVRVNKARQTPVEQRS
jgi:hypothetical protein